MRLADVTIETSSTRNSIRVSMRRMKGQTDAGMDGWTPLFAKYPEAAGFIELSPVGFDRAKTHAVIYVSHHCGGLCGGGGYGFLQKENGVWRRASPLTAAGSSYCRWMSLADCRLQIAPPRVGPVDRMPGAGCSEALRGGGVGRGVPVGLRREAPPGQTAEGVDQSQSVTLVSNWYYRCEPPWWQ